MAGQLLRKVTSVPAKPRGRSLLDEMLDEADERFRRDEKRRQLLEEVLNETDKQFRKKEAADRAAEKAEREARKRREKKTSDAKREDLMGDFVQRMVRPIDRATAGGTDKILKSLDDLMEELLIKVGRSDLTSKSVINKLDLKKNERTILEQATPRDWQHMRDAAKPFVASFKAPRTPKSRDATIRSLKGTLAEILFILSPAFRSALKRARAKAKALGLNPKDVRLVRSAKGLIIEDGRGGMKELTDGMLVIDLPHGRVRILSVFEMKSPSNFKDLARRRESKKLTEKGEILQPSTQKEGQFSHDFERLSETVVELDGKLYPPGMVVVSKTNTEWVAVIPKDKRLPKRLRERIKREIPNFKEEKHELRNDTLDNLTEELLIFLSGP